MPKRSKKLDLNQLAKSLVDQATGEEEIANPILTGKKADSQKGGVKGGKTRMEQLTKEQRSELAKKAAQARWDNAAPATKAGATKPGLTKQR
ncbi:MAG: histone H1 [Hydrogenophilales bacterium]|nr:histone H1 [Hydrogenophilales bacterium]